MNRGVTVSIVSHGQAHMLPALLAQMNQHCSHVIAKVIVTLNLPEPALPDVKAVFPVQILINEKPLGFGQNHNQAFAQCDSPWFLVLNPDIEVSTDVLTPMLDAMADEDGLAAPLVREPPLLRVTPERGVLTPWEVFTNHVGFATPAVRPVWFPGMFLLFRAAAYAGLGGFDTRFHMYCEDFDICARLRLSGWRLRRVRDVDVLHRAQRSSHVRLIYLLWHITSLLRLWRSDVVWRYWLFVRRGAQSQA